MKISFWIKNFVVLIFIITFLVVKRNNDLSFDENFENYKITFVIALYCIGSNILYLRRIYDIKIKGAGIDNHSNTDTINKNQEPQSEAKNSSLNEQALLDHDSIKSTSNSYQGSYFKPTYGTYYTPNNVEEDFSPNYATTLDEDFNDTYQSPTLIVPENNEETEDAEDNNESELLEKFRILDDIEKEHIDRVIDTYLDFKKQEKS